MRSNEMSTATVQPPSKMNGSQGETLHFRSRALRFRGADKTRGGSDRPHEAAANGGAEPSPLTFLSENRSYWTRRAPSYSLLNQDELLTSQRAIWQDLLTERIKAHFPGRAPGELRVLEVGTGPGFLAIILAELGFSVSAIDLTPSMLKEARRNAGALATRISFLEMDAQALDFPDESFDVLVSRNLTWNLPEPKAAYLEWHRVLRPGGLMLNFDANWYAYLFDERMREGYEADRANTAYLGIKDKNVGENFDVMEKLASRLPLSRLTRPDWDAAELQALHFTVRTDLDVWRRLWSKEDAVNFASTPLFLIEATRGEPFGPC